MNLVTFCAAVAVLGTCDAFVAPVLTSTGISNRRGGSWRIAMEVESSSSHLGKAAATTAPMMTAKSSRRDLLLKGAGAVVGAGVASYGADFKASATELPWERIGEEVDAWKGWEATRKFKRAGKEIELEQRFAKTRQNGMAVYEGNEVMTSYIESLGKDYWKGKSVLELGCGTGFGSITTFLMGAKQVTASDRNPAVLDLSRANFDRNVKPSEMGGRVFKTQQLLWGSGPCQPQDLGTYNEKSGSCYPKISVVDTDFVPKDAPDNRFDVIIGSDLTYTDNVLPLLIDTITAFTHSKSEIILTWCEPKIFTWNTPVMDELNQGIEEFSNYFNVQRITEGEQFKGHDNTFIVRLTRKTEAQMKQTERPAL